jgi:signal transduction histidine kinase
LKANSSIQFGGQGTYLKKLFDHHQTLAFRLTLLYAGVFTITLFAAFITFYLLELRGSHGLSREALSGIREDFREHFGIVLIAVILFSTLVGHFIARRALSGVQSLMRTAEAITGGELHRRVPVKDRNDEIDRLAATFNTMLERIEALVHSMKEVNDNIAHDLQSPVARIRGVAELVLTSTDAPEEHRSMVGGILGECDRLLNMINTMLDISEAETGMAGMTIEDIDVTQIVQEAVGLFEPVAEDKDITIDLKTQGPVYVPCDRQKLQRVIANLLDNAIKYTPSGEKLTVTVNIDNNHALITVSDTGMGIPEEDLPHIFERFYRGEKSRSETGNGLGLSLAYAFVRAHQGTIEVKSQLSMGSSFIVKLPRL